MIQINGTIIIDDSFDDQAFAAVTAMMEATRQEDGCLEYTTARDLSDPHRLILLERWRDRAALDAHFASPHMAAFREALARTPPQSMDLRLYETDEGEKLG